MAGCDQAPHTVEIAVLSCRASLALFCCTCRILRHTCSDVSGISRSVMPREASASSAALITAAGAPMAPAFPAALGAERVVGAGLAFVALGDERRQIVRARHRIVHERPADRLAAAIIGATLQQRLADALGEPAVDLGLDDHRVDDGADVVDAPKPDDLDAAGVRIDLELADMRPVAEGEARRIVDRGLLQAGLDGLERKVVRHVSRLGDRCKGYAPVGAGDDECAISEIDVARGRLEQMGCDQLAFGDDLIGGTIERAAADRDRARAESAGAVRYRIGVAFDHLDFFDRHAEL